MKPFFKFVGIISIVPLLIGSYFFDNIKGYYRFKQYCEKEGGLRIYESLEKNVGWWAKDKYDAREASQLNYVAFVRYTDQKDDKNYDLHYIGNNPNKDHSFKKMMSDASKPVIYKWHHVSEEIPNELRLGKFGYEILDAESNRILSRYYSFSYSKFDRRRTLLDIPSGVSCFYSPAKHKDDVSSWRKALNTSFKH